jgi:hypothetical protein
MVEDHYDVLMEMQEAEKKKPRKKPAADTVLPSYPSKKSKPKTMVARSGGYVKAADGIAQRGKTRGRMV